MEIVGLLSPASLLKCYSQKRKNAKKAPVFNFSAIHLVRDPQSKLL